MPHQWHYVQSGTQYGPVSTVEIKQLADNGQLARNDMVWKEGLPNWIKAEEVNGLFPKAALTTPPPLLRTQLPPITPAVARARAKGSTLCCPRCGDTNVLALSIVWGKGTTSTTGRKIGVGGLTGGLLGHIPQFAALAAGTALSSKSHSTMLAKECEPPKKKSLGWPMAAMIFGGLGLLGGVLALVDPNFGHNSAPGHSDPASGIPGLFVGLSCLRRNWNFPSRALA